MHRLFLPAFAALLLARPGSAAEVQILLPQNRTAFQTNEWIDVSVVRSDKQPLAAGTLTLSLTGADGSSVVTPFAVAGDAPRRTEHLHLSGWLLRPGKYTVEAEADGAKASVDLELVSHVRKSDFRLINWGRASKPDQQLIQGEDNLGYNLFYGHYGQDTGADFLRAGVDYISNCTMGGAHQMDIRQECDWSDPYVSRGGTRRVAREALQDRTRPNVPGVHFYDEPGLTWEKHPETGEVTPHMIASQVRSYVAAFGREPLPYHKVDPNNPDQVARWKEWATWKLGFMDAAWKEAQFGVSQVRPDYLSLTQSQYGWSAFTDGYYFNVARSLPITSGHGGYHDFGPGFFNPSYFLEMARARDHWKQCWYLPTWYGNTTSDQFRLEQYLSFQTGIQGLMSPPDLEPATNPSARQGIVETNHLFQKLGPIFTTMPVTKPPVAMLYSLSQAIHTQTKDMSANYAHAMKQGQNLPLTYLAGKLIQQQFLPIVEEDILDGTLASDHRVVVLTSLDYLDPAVVRALEDFISHNGVVLLTADCTVSIKGAVKLPVTPRMPDQEAIDALMKEKKYSELGPYTTTGKHVQGATSLAKAIQAELDKKGIEPILVSDVPTIVVTRQAAGTVEYLFAVNATPDDEAKTAKGQPEKNAPKAVSATLTLDRPGTPVYDAVHGGPVPELQNATRQLKGEFRFGPGEMRVFARPSRPIGGVRLAAPVLTRQLVLEQEPIKLDLAATVVDGSGNVVTGSIPMRVEVVDPLGFHRYDLHRTTKLGQLAVTLPLAANDPGGSWTVRCTELLANTQGAYSFQFFPPPHARAIAGATPRAVYYGDDREKAFRFARTHHDVTIVKGKSAFNDAAADRLITALAPWGVRAKVMELAEASKPRPVTEEEARTWIGLRYTGRGSIKPGQANDPVQVGYAVQGPVILLGNPEDTPIIQTLLKERFLPYTPSAAHFPGPGRGYFAWQRDGVGPGQESITLIAYDEAGMAEAAGSFYEAVAGLEPLTKWTLPQSDTITAAKSAPGKYPAAVIAWTAMLPDRIVALTATDNGVTAVSHDGTQAAVSPEGKATPGKVLGAAELDALEKQAAKPDPAVAKAQARSDRLLKLTAVQGGKVAVAYWGGTVRLADDKGTVLAEQLLPQDVTALTWVGNRLIAGLADGRVLALEKK